MGQSTHMYIQHLCSCGYRELHLISNLGRTQSVKTFTLAPKIIAVFIQVNDVFACVQSNNLLFYIDSSLVTCRCY